MKNGPVINPQANAPVFSAAETDKFQSLTSYRLKCDEKKPLIQKLTAEEIRRLQLYINHKEALEEKKLFSNQPRPF
ncbi:MAG: hypothetical protein JSR17_13580 [Proteobacteria bacterium]|nr:hypothetical protein [Pseudomonadota bacterium]